MDALLPFRFYGYEFPPFQHVLVPPKVLFFEQRQAFKKPAKIILFLIFGSVFSSEKHSDLGEQTQDKNQHKIRPMMMM